MITPPSAMVKKIRLFQEYVVSLAAVGRCVNRIVPVTRAVGLLSTGFVLLGTWKLLIHNPTIDANRAVRISQGDMTLVRTAADA